MYCVSCHAPITRDHVLWYGGRCDACAYAPDDLPPAQRAYAAHLLRRTLAQVRGLPLVGDDAPPGRAGREEAGA